jgi:hypothetical protein
MRRYVPYRLNYRSVGHIAGGIVVSPHDKYAWMMSASKHEKIMEQFEIIVVACQKRPDSRNFYVAISDVAFDVSLLPGTNDRKLPASCSA